MIRVGARRAPIVMSRGKPGRKRAARQLVSWPAGGWLEEWRLSSGTHTHRPIVLHTSSFITIRLFLSLGGGSRLAVNVFLSRRVEGKLLIAP